MLARQAPLNSSISAISESTSGVMRSVEASIDTAVVPSNSIQFQAGYGAQVSLQRRGMPLRPRPRRPGAAPIAATAIDVWVSVNYSLQMVEVRQTETFAGRLRALDDDRAAAKIAQRIVRLQSELFGDAKPVGAGISELRIDHGPGYRVYFTSRGRTIVLLLCGGDKGTQRTDIRKAKELAANL